MAKMEIWKLIPGFEGYTVSNLGRVKSYKRKAEKILKQATDAPGYKMVLLQRNKRSYLRRVHVLVTLAFLGPRSIGLEVCHNDGDKANNHLDNLRYDTHKSNIEDAQRHGVFLISQTRIVAEQKRRQKIERTREIRKKYANGNITLLELANIYGLSVSGVSRLVNGNKHIKAGGPIKGIDY